LAIALGVGPVASGQAPTPLAPPTPPAPTPAQAAARPPIFADTPFDEALKANATDGKLLVVKFTAEWCAPCKQMDRTTWRDAKVVEFVKDSGVALSVDVDVHPDIARRYAVRAMPTIMVFRAGEPLDRAVGYRDADRLLAWLSAAKQGKTELGLMQEKAEKAGDDLGVKERLDLARSLLQGEKLEAATEHYLWLWKHMLDKEPAYLGVRSSFMASEIEDLCSRHVPAKAAFTKLRDEAETRLKGQDKSWDDLSDWIVLNECLGDDDKTLAWFDRIKADPDAAETIERFAFRLEPLLAESGRRADLGRIIRAPLTRLQREWGMVAMSAQLPGADEALRARMREMAVDRFRAQAGELHAALLAAGRVSDARAVARRAGELDDTPQTRVGIVESALDAGQAAPHLLDLLDQVDAAKGPDTSALRERVRKELAKSSG
jgi:thioredoxin 1